MNAIKTAYRAARKTGHSAKSAISIARESARFDDLGLPRYPAGSIIRQGGVLFTVEIKYDTDSTPWDWECFYGTPSRIYRYEREDKAGITQIHDSQGDRWDYDRTAAIAECLKQNPQWPRGTRFELACEAVDREIDYWRQWLNDDRYFIGITVTAESSEGFTADASLCGIEAGDREGYWRSCAMDLIADCQHEITRQHVEQVYALNDALEADFAGIEFA